LQYVDLDIVRHAAAILAAVEQAGQNVGCEAELPEDELPKGGLPESALCGRPAAYLVPDATRAGGGGQDVERRPAMYCGMCLERTLGHAPEEQPVFRRVAGPGE
jgi:hypothetical protein